MNTETKPKKESKLDIDSNYDLRLVSTLSPALRWVLTLPIAFIAMFAVQVGFGTLVKLINSNLPMGEIVNTIMLSTVMLTKYAIFVIAATSTAPLTRNKKFIAAIAAAFIGALLCVGGTAISLSLSVAIDKTMLISTFVASILGLLLGVWEVRRVTSKPPTEENKASQL